MTDPPKNELRVSAIQKGTQGWGWPDIYELNIDTRRRLTIIMSISHCIRCGIFYFRGERKMNNINDLPINELLNKVAEAIDISDELFDSATKRYESLAEWLERDESCLARFDSKIFPQGSFLLGTVTRPITDEDIYDIDLVCSINASSQTNSQERIKTAIGSEVKKYRTAKAIKKDVVEGDYCWTLEYADSARFSMDILPAIPDPKVTIPNIPNETSKHSVRLTCKRDANYQKIVPLSTWILSNPSGYGQWFASKMQDIYNKARTTYFERHKTLYASAEEIPRHKVKTPLQRAVQLLKRHRSIVFADDLTNAPISIIITTLAAQAYGGEDNVFEALYNITHKMDQYIHTNDGKIIIPNPVNPTENFADKWNEDTKLKDAFHTWLGTAQRDIAIIVSRNSFDSSMEYMKRMFGSRVVGESAKTVQPNRQSALLLPFRKIAEAYSKYRFNVQHAETVPGYDSIPIAIKVDAFVIDELGRKISIENDALPIPKHRKLLYFASSSIHKPYTIYWQVVNTGSDAKYQNGLRGGLFDKKSGWSGGAALEEVTRYSGTHWVECFYKRNGMFIARSGRFIVNIE